MPKPLILIAATALLLPATVAKSQTVRFETSVGNIDFVLNPTDDPNLQPLVDNFLAYVGLGRYHGTVINRADEGFVLQLGGFVASALDPEQFVSQTIPIESFPSVVVDADGDGAVDFETLSNTPGTVSLALAAGQVNSGTSSFFINISDNSGPAPTTLDSQGFVPFAVVQEVADMQDGNTVDAIFGLDQVSLPGGLTFSDIPVLNDDGVIDGDEQLVIVERAFVLESDDPLALTRAIAGALGFPLSDTVVGGLAGGGGSVIPPPSLIVSAPEPGAALLTAPLLGWLIGRRRRGR